MPDQALLGTSSPGAATAPHGQAPHGQAPHGQAPHGRTRRRPVLPAGIAYWLAAGVIGLCLFASVVPSPLYHAYAVAWHFSPLTLTLVYAVYAFGVLAALLLAGRVSDQAGRRLVLLAALGTLMVSAVLFIAADSVGWLFVARGVQGLATGTALSAASAALLDLHARHDPVSAGLANAVASCAGLGLGILVSSALVESGTAPRTLPYVLLLMLFAAALAGAYLMPEPVPVRTAVRLTPQRPSVPAGIRRPFLLASLAVLASWSIGGLFFSLGAQLSARLFDTTNVILASIGGIALPLSAALAQLTLRRVPPWLGASAGLTAVIPGHHRAAVMSAFYLVAYSSLSVPAVIAGVVVTHLGLAATFEIFGSVVAGIALAGAAEAWRTRPAARRSRVAVPAQAVADTGDPLRS